MFRGVRIAGTVALGTLSFLAVPGGSVAADPSIVVYSGQVSQSTNNLVTAFEHQTGILVQVRLGDSTTLANQIIEEGSHSPADVFLAEDSPELMTLQQQGLLAPLPASILDQIPSRDNSPSGDWVAVALRVNAIDWNPSMIKGSELPRSILDLAKPQWKGKVGIAPTDPDFAPLVNAVVSAYGQKAALSWLEGLKQNARTYPDELDLAYEVLSGVVACGIVTENYMYTVQYQYGTQSRLSFFPGGDVGSASNIAGVAMLASSTRQPLAEEFIDFVVSKRGQEIIADSKAFEYPARPGVEAETPLPPLDRIPHTSLTPGVLGNDQEAAQLIQEVGLY